MSFWKQVFTNYNKARKKCCVRIIPPRPFYSIIFGFLIYGAFFIFEGDADFEIYLNLSLEVSGILLTFNGVILAFSWHAMTKIYDILSLPLIRKYFHKQGGYGQKYFHHVEHVRVFQFLATISSIILFIIAISITTSINLVIIFVAENILFLHVHVAFLSVVVALSLYSVIIAKDLIKAIHILLEKEADVTHLLEKKNNDEKGD